MKGLRLRVQQSQIMVGMIKALGAEPIELPYGQVLTALRTGIIDGAENNWPSYVTTEHYKAANHYSLTEHTMGPEVLVMSRRVWDGLSPEDQRIFREAARESARFMRRQWQEWERDSRSQAESAGNRIVSEIDKRPFEAAMNGLYDATLSDAKLRHLVDRIREVK
jgi:TRAP-type C4-dicarboxylate transport system substrate-binding protein